MEIYTFDNDKRLGYNSVTCAGDSLRLVRMNECSTIYGGLCLVNRCRENFLTIPIQYRVN